MLQPICINEHTIYDIFHNGKDIVIISPYHKKCHNYYTYDDNHHKIYFILEKYMI